LFGSDYKLEIFRGKEKGSYIFTSTDGTVLKGECFWKLTKRIPAGTYHGASTQMAKKGSSGIFLYEFAPKKDPARPYQGSKNNLYKGIFVHAGKGAYHSDGCIVIEKAEFAKIVAKIKAKDTPNVSIVVKD